MYQRGRCQDTHCGLICKSEKWIISQNVNVYGYKPFNRMRWSPLEGLVGLHQGWSMPHKITNISQSEQNS